MGMETEQISKATGLNEEEIKNYRRNVKSFEI